MLLWSECKRTKHTIPADLKQRIVLFWAFLPNREATVDSPVITSVASTVQLLQSHQGHVIGGQVWDAILGSWAEVDPVEAAATDIMNSLVAVGFGVPCVATVLLLSQLLPHITDTGG